MLKNLTIIFNAYFSQQSLIKVLKNLKNFKIIIIENSLQQKIKTELEKKYKNVNVIIPSHNLGLAKGYNLGISKAKTKYVFLNTPDMLIKSRSIKKLLTLSKKIKKLGIISPRYDDEKNFKNYIINKNSSDKGQLLLVDSIDNNFLINKKLVKNNLFDENYFLYFETVDFCLNLKRNGLKLFVAKNVFFKHFHSRSVDKKYDKIVKKIRAWHYNWSKFYYYRKNFNYIYAITKILPNFYQSIKNFIINFFKLDFFKSKLNLIEIYGIISAVMCLKSFYRAKK